MKKTTKILSIILALTFIFSSMSLISFADDGITRYYFDSINGDDATKNIVKIILTVAFAVIPIAIGCRLLTVSDSVVQSILEKWLETLFSGIGMLR